MSHEIEYRVRAVTRYTVTAHTAGTTKSVGEFDALELASGVGAALALAYREGGHGEATFTPYEGPLPGKVMRCKVVLHTRIPQWGANIDTDGNYLGRTIDNGGYKRPDPTDPANVKPDGDRLMFGAVCGSFDKDGNNAVEENRIFGYWSPSFSIDGHVRNQAVLANLEQGAEYYVDFTPAPKTAKS